MKHRIGSILIVLYGLMALGYGGINADAQEQQDRIKGNREVIVTPDRSSGQRIGANEIAKDRVKRFPPADALPPDEVEPLSPNTLRVRIQFRKEMGRKDYNGTKGQFTCGVFWVRTTFVDRESTSGPFGRDATVGRVLPHSLMREGDEHYSCWFTVMDLPFNKNITVYGSLLDEQHLLTERWTDGSQAEPPPGYQRAVIGNRAVRLTPSQPSEIVDLQMVYIPIPSQPR